MPKSVKLRKLLKALDELGFQCLRQKGDHAFYRHPDGRTTLVPLHPEIKVKLLTKIIKHDLKMTMEEFVKRL